jgi:DNA repair protein RecN (Recombination protein N)
MLVHLLIRDFAIIDAVELEFAGGLTALTGETGAGKSIIVDAVMLALGGRASIDSLRHGAARAEITATFDTGDEPPVRCWREQQSIDCEDGELILRRVIGRDGRSRQYVNGQSLPAQSVRELGELLIDIHGQQEFQSLVRHDAQRMLVDQHGGHDPLLATVADIAAEWQRLSAERSELVAMARDREARLELLRYQVGELDALGLADGEADSLHAERGRLANRGRLAESAQSALALAWDADGADAHALAARAAGQLRGAAALDARLTGALQAIESSLIGLREAGSLLGAYLDALDADPARQEHVEQRVAAIEDLARKHHVPAAELPRERLELREQLLSLEQSKSRQGDLDERIAAVRKNYDGAAAKLSDARRNAAERLATAVTGLMRQLGMPGGKFEIAVEADATQAPAAAGADRVEFRVSANPGQPAKAVAKVASGGELSRISLAVQVAAAHRRGRSCMIFDEVDAGVGGGVAEIVGRQLRDLGENGQVLCVTHLAQVASQAHHQLRVTKLTDGRTSRTTATALGADERIEELARMLGGVQITRKARDHAREMLRVAATARR